MWLDGGCCVVGPLITFGLVCWSLEVFWNLQILLKVFFKSFFLKLLFYLYFSIILFYYICLSWVVLIFLPFCFVSFIFNSRFFTSWMFVSVFNWSLDEYFPWAQVCLVQSNKNVVTVGEREAPRARLCFCFFLTPRSHLQRISITMQRVCACPSGRVPADFKEVQRECPLSRRASSCACPRSVWSGLECPHRDGNVSVCERLSERRVTEVTCRDVKNSRDASGL